MHLSTFSLSKGTIELFGKEQMRFCDAAEYQYGSGYRTLNMEAAILCFYWNINALHSVLVLLFAIK